MTKFLRSYATIDGLLIVETINNEDEAKRNAYVFQKDNDFYSHVVSVWSIGATNLIHRTGFYVKGRPLAEEQLEVWADGTDMPEEMAKAFINHLYPKAVLVNHTVEYGKYGAFVAHIYDVLS